MIHALARHVPLCGGGNILDSDIMLHIGGSSYQVVHKRLYVLLWNPCGAEAHTDLGRFEILGLYPFQGFYVGAVKVGVLLGKQLGFR